MNVDTGEFEALKADVADLRTTVSAMRINVAYTYECGVQDGMQAVAGVVRRRRYPGRQRPAHLRPVDGGAS